MGSRSHVKEVLPAQTVGKMQSWCTDGSKMLCRLALCCCHGRHVQCTKQKEKGKTKKKTTPAESAGSHLLTCHTGKVLDCTHSNTLKHWVKGSSLEEKLLCKGKKFLQHLKPTLQPQIRQIP